MAKLLIATLALIFSCVSVHAEEDFDWEMDFGIKRKSTISDFPLQEIGVEDLSDAAIGGALHASTSGSVKPAYMEQNEQDSKRKTSELEENDSLNSSGAPETAINLQEFIPRIEIGLPQQTVNATANGLRGFNHDTSYTNNNNAFERP